MFKTFAFLDFETTGLTQPAVTEVCALAVDARYPDRIRNKLLMCCSVSKHIEEHAAKLTGLTNLMLTDGKPFIDCGVRLLTAFLRTLPAPVCMLAHNGDAFDFKILADALAACDDKLPAGVYEMDTLPLFKDIDRTQSRAYSSYKLKSVHDRLVPNCAVTHKEHGAEADCETLLECFIKMRCSEYIKDNFDFAEIATE